MMRRFFKYITIAAGGLVLLIAIGIGTLDYVVTATHNEAVTVGVKFSHYYCGNADCYAADVTHTPDDYVFLKNKPLLLFSNTLALDNLFFKQQGKPFCLTGRVHRFDALLMPFAPQQPGRGFRIERLLPGVCPPVSGGKEVMHVSMQVAL